MSDTPRTDAHTRQLIDTLQHPHWIEFARQLERETVSLRADLDALQHTLRGMEVQEERLKLENAALRAALEAMVSANDGVAVYPTPEAKAQNAALKLAKAAIDAARKETSDDAIMRQHLKEGGTPT